MPSYTENDIINALKAIANGQSIKKAAFEHGMPRLTLQYRMKGVQTRDIAFSDLQRLSPTQESHLAEWVNLRTLLNASYRSMETPSLLERTGGSLLLRETHLQWFKHLAIPEIMAIKASNRYNIDKTSILEGRGSNRLVLRSLETRSIRKKQPRSRA
ncbi:transposase [Colletotrichum kahawae]|uniref:Transposase n=1 Tax=Colletotrichum kahawae TaxID=34407 RepID=A0AAD9YMY0_COLKA|nr:transposase [Colletotrichum kahawae]